MDDLCLTDIERHQDKDEVDRCQNGEDPDESPECRCIELLHRSEQTVALEGEEHVEPDGYQCQHDQQRDRQDRPPAEPAPPARDEVQAGQPPELSPPPSTPDEQPGYERKPDDSQSEGSD